MYRVESVKYEEKQVPSWNGTIHNQVTQSIKIEGYGRWIAPYRFRHCTTQEKRTLSLGGLLDESVEVAVVTKKSRRIERMEKSERDKVILATLFSAIIDGTRNNASVVEWSAKKGKRLYDIQESDVKPFLKMKISDIIKMVEIEK